jgi:GDPmannose 4,6-dehydratase
MINKKAFITGVTGQDGSYLVDLLISKGYEVHGLIRQSTQFTPDRWGHLKSAMLTKKFKVHHGDLMDASGMRAMLENIQPDEVYNLAAQSHVGISFEQPVNTTEVTALGALNLLDAIKRSKLDCKFYQASSSEMFGKVRATPQSEETPFYPRSPYGCAKVYAHYITQNYRESYGIFACSGILFNHESERRGENFVTRKITRAVGRIKAGLQDELVLGNTSAFRDWGYAPEYVEAMWLMLQQEKPDDYVIGTGEQHSVQEFVEKAFSHAGLDVDKYLKTDKSFMRPSEVDTLIANNKKAKETLKWEPRVSFDLLVKKMVEHDIVLAQKEKLLLEQE